MLSRRFCSTGRIHPTSILATWRFTCTKKTLTMPLSFSSSTSLTNENTRHNRFLFCNSDGRLQFVGALRIRRLLPVAKPFLPVRILRFNQARHSTPQCCYGLIERCVALCCLCVDYLCKHFRPVIAA